MVALITMIVDFVPSAHLVRFLSSCSRHCLFLGISLLSLFKGISAAPSCTVNSASNLLGVLGSCQQSWPNQPESSANIPVNCSQGSA